MSFPDLQSLKDAAEEFKVTPSASPCARGD